MAKRNAEERKSMTEGRSKNYAYQQKGSNEADAGDQTKARKKSKETR